mgnify:CR=1 FL=1
MRLALVGSYLLVAYMASCGNCLMDELLIILDDGVSRLRLDGGQSELHHEKLLSNRLVVASEWLLTIYEDLSVTPPQSRLTFLVKSGLPIQPSVPSNRLSSRSDTSP